MTFSRWIRWSAAIGIAAGWIATVSPAAHVSSLQSPLETPGPLSPIATAVLDPFTGSTGESCDDLIPCTDQPVTPQSDFSTFIPSAGSGEPVEQIQEPTTPPDLGTVLNYIAIGIIVIGVPLRLYWYMQDRRKRTHD